MPKLRVHNLAISLDGFASGEGQSLETPFGHAGMRLMEKWFFATNTFQQMQGRTGETGLDDDFASAWGDNIGAEIMGRRKFGPQTGPWEDDGWRGWWGEEPPFHSPVVVLTHYPRPEMVIGETTFHFKDASPSDALDLAFELAGGKDVRLGGGANVVRQFLAADLVDYLHVVVSPIILGRGERLWDGLEGLEEHFDVETTASPSGVVHHVFTRTAL